MSSPYGSDFDYSYDNANRLTNINNHKGGSNSSFWGSLIYNRNIVTDDELTVGGASVGFFDTDNDNLHGYSHISFRTNSFPEYSGRILVIQKCIRL